MELTFLVREVIFASLRRAMAIAESSEMIDYLTRARQGSSIRRSKDWQHRPPPWTDGVHHQSRIPPRGWRRPIATGKKPGRSSRRFGGYGARAFQRIRKLLAANELSACGHTGTDCTRSEAACSTAGQMRAASLLEESELQCKTHSIFAQGSSSQWAIPVPDRAKVHFVKRQVV